LALTQAYSAVNKIAEYCFVCYISWLLFNQPISTWSPLVRAVP